ncbi:hypothetical protein T4B_6286 [Trichinella pseudospiralis]|uniref:Uncharacterized protein n=3 Tax=Trichinella pseudospiralis TaxID=6337 RepID=A0A0V1FPY7_TRIPS|nr:hypothetical protein T4A_1940 [Trichinella pseudospiralis]KRY88064.1 hypothetical protein T4D_7765 [Trichinella pseudospiralis]KRZ33165.1 hypothetical protein T4B_6286 [Trichinella pseudospiralis]KRZ39536.1 hypothetical protein T4C_4679 [Trichinella pseudospiralis]
MDSKDGDYDEKLIKRAKDALILEAKRAKERSKTMGTFGWLPPKRLTQGSRRMLGFTLRTCLRDRERASQRDKCRASSSCSLRKDHKKPETINKKTDDDRKCRIKSPKKPIKK